MLEQGQGFANDHLDRALKLSRQAGIEPIHAYAAAARGLLELGLGNYQYAATELTRASSLTARHGLGDPCAVQWRPDYIESLASTGRLTDARDQLAVLDRQAAATGSQWAKAAAARCRGLLQDGPDQAIAELKQAVTMANKCGSRCRWPRASATKKWRPGCSSAPRLSKSISATSTTSSACTPALAWPGSSTLGRCSNDQTQPRGAKRGNHKAFAAPE